MNYLIGAAVALGMTLGGYFYGHHEGENAAQVTYLAEKNAAVKAVTDKLNQAIKNADTQQAINEENARRASNGYQTAVETIQSQSAAALLAARRAGGLRISAAVCGSNRPATSIQAPSPSGPDGPGAGTVELPDAVTERLYALAQRADTLAEQLRGLQSWVRLNGFYGTSQPIGE